MLKYLFLIFLAFAAVAQADVRCESLFTDKDFRYALNAGPITLVPLHKSHAPQLKEILNDSAVRRFFSGKASVKEILESDLQRANRRSGGDLDTFDGIWTIFYQQQIVGYFMLGVVSSEWIPSQIRAHYEGAGLSHRNLVVGYAMNSNFRGLGLATSALNVGLQFAKDVLHAENVFASVNNENFPSIHVLEKNGFQSVLSTEKNIKFLKKL